MAGSGLAGISQCPSKGAREANCEVLGSGTFFFRFENKQSNADLDEHGGIKREALLSSLGCLGVSRMAAA